MKRKIARRELPAPLPPPTPEFTPWHEFLGGPTSVAIAALLTAPTEEAGLEQASLIAAALPRLNAPVREFWRGLRREAWERDESYEDTEHRHRTHAVYIKVLEFVKTFPLNVDDETVDSIVPGWKKNRKVRERYGLDLDSLPRGSRQQVRGIGSETEGLKPFAAGFPRKLQLLELLSNGLSEAEAAQAMGIADGTARAHLHQLRQKARAQLGGDYTSYTQIANGEGLISLGTPEPPGHYTSYTELPEGEGPIPQPTTTGRRSRRIENSDIDHGRTRRNFINTTTER